MCECGCGDASPFAWFSGPNGTVYALVLYWPCNNGCDTPAGVIVQRYSAKEAKAADVKRTPKMEWQLYGADYAEHFVTVVHPQQIAAAAKGKVRLDKYNVAALGDPNVLSEAITLTLAQAKRERDEYLARTSGAAQASESGSAPLSSSPKERD